MFGIAIARAVADAQITAVDWHAVLSVARENADAAGVTGRYHTLDGSAFDTDWGSGFDLVLLANFLHQLDRDGCVTLHRKARRSLVSEGRAVAIEFLLNEDRVSPRFSAMFAFQMLGSTPHGEAYTAREFEDMGRAAGFARDREAVATHYAKPHPVRAGMTCSGEQAPYEQPQADSVPSLPCRRCSPHVPFAKLEMLMAERPW